MKRKLTAAMMHRNAPLPQRNGSPNTPNGAAEYDQRFASCVIFNCPSLPPLRGGVRKSKDTRPFASRQQVSWTARLYAHVQGPTQKGPAVWPSPFFAVKSRQV